MELHSVLIAKDSCVMTGSENQALVIGKEYKVNRVDSRNLYVKSEVADFHAFDRDSNDPAYWGNFFDLKK